jgi:acid phosphatase type 7
MARHRRIGRLAAAAVAAILSGTGATFSPGAPVGIGADGPTVTTGPPSYGHQASAAQPPPSLPSGRLLAEAVGVAPAVGPAAADVGPPETEESPSPLALGPDPLLIAAGDIATCQGKADDETARLIDRLPGTVVVVGDAVYPDGATADFEACYGPTWGRHLERTRPIPGNHEYHSPGADPYYAYFRGRGGAPGHPWYAFNVGTWRVYALDSDCSAIGGCGAQSPEGRWLRRDLAAHHRRCSIAFMHHPRFSSGAHGGSLAVLPLWRPLLTAGVDVVISGHDHDYERFAPQTAGGLRSTRHGIREFVVGTGGAPLRQLGVIRRNSQARSTKTHGVLVLALERNGYAWQFVGVPGSTFTDTGQAACRH